MRNRNPLILGAGALLVLAVMAAYHRCFTVPFLWDDTTAVVENPSIRRLWPPDAVLHPPLIGGPATGRPLLNLTFAVNYAAGGLNPAGYHAVNLLLHAASTLVLFGLVRRTLLRGRRRAVSAGAFSENREPRRAPAAAAPAGGYRPTEATFLAFAVALLWSVHPLASEAVVYISQRAELLVSLLFLLTLYCHARSLESPESGRWQTLAVTACLLGMASKEVMAAAPLAVLLYDRAFGAGSFRGAWRQRRWMYVGLAATWGLLGALVAAQQQRGGSAGFGLGIRPLDYLLTQCMAIVHYLRLAAWPQPLVFEYGRPLVSALAPVLPQAAGLLALGGLTVWALVRRSAAGFVGFCFFAILAPSSSVVPIITQTMAEHRMYLPLAAVVVGVVSGLHALLGRRSLWLWPAAAVALALVSARRLDVYQTAPALWADTVAKMPQNDRAHFNLGRSLAQAGRPGEALAPLREAIRLAPQDAAYRLELGNAFLALGRTDEAAQTYADALRLHPDNADLHYSLGLVLRQRGQNVEAADEFARSLQRDPDREDCQEKLAMTLVDIGRAAEAVGHFEAALRLNGDNPDTRFNLAQTLLALNRVADAINQLQQVVAAKPDDAEAQFTLGSALAAAQRWSEATTHLAAAVRLAPDLSGAREQLESVRRSAAVPSR